ncbi:MAG TPA: protein translocase subunit SecF, partial [Candidatus Paceibacterota bacterium]|nr:protein translocase subunit SecF [Candidatus Paceibacterota bacterium]
MDITKYEKYFFILPVVLSILAIIAIAMWGLKPGIDLAGGSLLQVTFPSGRPTVEQIHEVARPLNFGEVRAQPTGENGYILRQRDLTTEEKNSLEAALATLGEVREDQYTSVGPILGSELVRKAWIAIALVVISTIIFIAFAFRGVSRPVQSWKYGIVAIVTLLHDILIPVGLFAYLGYAVGAEVDALFIVALLTILGISINDTIVIFDRIRENLRLNEEHHKRENFDSVVGRSIMQTLTRSINTSVTVIIVLVALYFLGPESTKNFALTLIV